MKKPSTSTAVVPAANIEEAWQEVGASFERFRNLVHHVRITSVLGNSGLKKAMIVRWV